MLLAISLVPMALVAIIYTISTTDLGADLATSSQKGLANEAHRLLHRIVEDYGRILTRDKLALELAIDLQTHEVERRLAEAAPKPNAVFLANDSVKDERFQKDLKTTTKFYHFDQRGKRVPLLVNFKEQVFFKAPDADPVSSAKDIALLADMSQAYWAIYFKISNLALWQYTGFESGVISSFPGVEGYPAGFDPRNRPWYRNTKRAGRLLWGEPYVDVLSGEILLTLSRPVYRPNGSFAGVTSIDFPFSSVLDEVRLPAEWASHARVMSVIRGAGDTNELRLKILVQKSYQNLKQPWQRPVDIEYLKADRPAELTSLVEDAEAGHSGVKRMRYNQVDSFWAYGAAEPGMPFPVIIIPYHFIVAQAAETKAKVLEMTIQASQITGAILVLVVMTVTAVAVFSSRSVSRPIRDLAEAAVDLANGDFEARVTINPGGELELLGQVFNAMGPRLKERERMQTSLALAKEVQQYLLPLEPPQSQWVEIAAGSSFCEELGGDYYDFVDLREVHPGRMGIVVGDVSGHGLASALLMATMRGGLHSLFQEHQWNPGRMFCVLNEIFLGSSGLDQFMTLFFGVLDETERSFRWVSAGHGPCHWMKAQERQIRELETTGIPLGILDDAEYGTAGPIRLSVGDALIIGTDGLWEAQNAAGEMFGVERLIARLEGCWDRNAWEIREIILAARREFCGVRPQDDDITLVVVKAV